MNRPVLFSVAAGSLILLVLLASWLFLDSAGRRAMSLAALLALLTQLPLHFALSRWRRRAERFAATLAIGFGARAVTILVAILVFVIPGRVSPAPLLLGLVVFLFSTSLLEAVLSYRAASSAGT